MKNQKTITRTLLLTALCTLSMASLCIVDRQAIESKEYAEKALSEANAAELSKGVKFENADEKSRTILDKAMSALNLAQNALSSTESILQDKEQSSESKNLASEAKKLARQAIKKAGSVLQSTF